MTKQIIAKKIYKIGIITGQFDEDETSNDLYKAAKKYAHTCVIDPLDFTVRFNGEHSILSKGDDLLSYDAMIIRGLNFAGDKDFQFEVFEQLDRLGVMMINSPAALQIAESKFLTSFILQENGFHVPQSLIVQTMQHAIMFLSEYKDIVAKPLYGFQGYGVIRVKKDEPEAKQKLESLLSEYRCICLQQFIPNPNRDIRAFVVGNKVVAAIYRLAKTGNWKTNIRAGGKAKPIILTKEQENLAVSVSQCLGLDYTGVDIIEGPEHDYILEVNGAPAWGGILEATGQNVAEDIIRYVIAKIKRRDS